MSGKANSFKKNIRNDTEGQPTRRKNRVSKSPSTQSIGISSNKIIKIVGLFLLILSVYCLVAFISYLFTWKEDQSYVSAANGGWNTLFKTRGARTRRHGRPRCAELDG